MRRAARSQGSSPASRDCRACCRARGSRSACRSTGIARVAARDAFDRGVERGDAARRHRAPGFEAQREGRAVGCFADALAITDQHRRAGALRQARSSVIVSAGMPKNGANSPSPAFGCWSGRIPATPPPCSSLNKPRIAGPFGAHLGHAVGVAVRGAHAAQEGFADLRIGRCIEDRERRARGEPLVQQLPVAVMRRGDDQALAGGDRRIEQVDAVRFADQREVAARAAASRSAGFPAPGASVVAQHRGCQLRALRRGASRDRRVRGCAARPWRCAHRGAAHRRATPSASVRSHGQGRRANQVARRWSRPAAKSVTAGV